MIQKGMANGTLILERVLEHFFREFEANGSARFSISKPIVFGMGVFHNSPQYRKSSISSVVNPSASQVSTMALS